MEQQNSLIPEIVIASPAICRIYPSKKPAATASGTQWVRVASISITEAVAIPLIEWVNPLCFVKRAMIYGKMGIRFDI